MKARSGHRLLSILVITASISTVTVPGITGAATTEYWNPGGSGGSGIWGTSPGDKNWNPVAGAASGNTVWQDTGNEVAVFQDAIGGTITVFTPVQVAGIDQQAVNYAIDAQTITLVPDSAANRPFIHVQTGTLSIDSVLDGTHGLLKTGSGNLLLSGADTYTGTTSVANGALTLSGSLASTSLDIASGATLVDSNGGLAAAAALTNTGTLTINSAESVSSYTQNPGGTLAGSAALTVTGTASLSGGTVTGQLLGNTDSGGNVLVASGASLGGGSLTVSGGTLTLAGTATNTPVTIGAGATLVDSNGGLAAAAALTNTGTLTINSAETVSSYTQNPGGTLAGSAALTVTGTASLSGGTVTGQLLGNTLNVVSGVVTNTGTLGTGTTHLDIAAGARLVGAGTQSYSLLTTSGSGSAVWQGSLTNTATLAPGGAGGVGALQVTSGNFTNSAGAVLKLDIAAASHDLLGTTGSANFAGTLDLNQVGSAVTPFVSIHVVDAAAYSGNFTTLTENLDGAVWFNPASGNIMRIAIPSNGNSLFGATANQSAAWVALYDDVIDPGITNVSVVPGGNPGYGITSGIASGNNPDLLWALTSSTTAGGLNASLLNHLSPEVYVGLSDYALQATRSHQRSAFAAPAVAPAQSGGKDASPAKWPWEMFVAADSFHIQSSGSQNQADFELGGGGILAGLRAKPTTRLQLAAYLAGDTGTIDGALIHGVSTGWSLGVLGEAMLEEASDTRLSAGISYGSYTFDGTRNSVAAASGGWLPVAVGFSGVTADALDVSVGVDSVVFSNEHFRLVPAFCVHAATGTMDSFRENSNPAVGSPIALAVGTDHYTSVLAELSLRGEAVVTSKLSVSGQLGISGGVGDDPHVLAARFAKGSRPFQTRSDALSNNSSFFGVSATYQLSSSASVALGYRAEFRSDAGTFNGLNLMSSFRF